MRKSYTSVKLEAFAENNINVIRKHSQKRRKCWLLEFSTFTTVILNVLCLKVIKCCDCYKH